MTERWCSFFKRKFSTFFCLGIFVFLGLSFFQQEASAVPVFARKYSTSCMTCHVGFPKLNAFGEAFKTNGYRLPSDEVFVKEPPVWLGSEAYKRVWPNAVWPGSIPGNVPIALRVIGQATFDSSKSKANGEAQNDLDFPHEIELNSLGTMGDNLAFNLGIALLDESDRTVVERAFLEWNDILAGESGIPHQLLNLRLGLIDPMAMPFSTSNQFLTTEGPSIYDFRISSETQPSVADSQTGLEIFGVVNKRLRYATGVVNGVARDGAHDAFTDNNNSKDVYVRTEYKWGGLAFGGNADANTQDQLGSGFSYFDQGPSLTLGTTGYHGVDQINATTDSEFYRVTGFLRANKGRYNLDVVGLYQNNDAAAGQVEETIDKRIGTWGFYTEGTAFIYPWMAVVARYERLNVGHIAVLGAANPTDNTNRLILSLPMYVRPNLRIVPEASVGLSDTSDGDVSDNFKLRVDFAY